MTARARRPALLDTSVLIRYPAAQVAEVADEVAVSAVSLGELEYGIGAASDPLEQVRRRRRVQMVLDTFEVLPFDAATAGYYGALATAVRERGRDPRPRRMDLQIAATAVRHGLILLTRNGRDFAGLEIALTVIDLVGSRPICHPGEPLTCARTSRLAAGRLTILSRSSTRRAARGPRAGEDHLAGLPGRRARPPW